MNATIATKTPKTCSLPIIGPLGTREDYEADVRAAEAAYDANKSGMNHEDLFTARAALRRHWLNDTALAPPPQRLASKKDVPGG